MRYLIAIMFAGAMIATGCKSRMGTTKEALAFPAFDSEAHRGGRAIMPENTIPAMLNALDLGVETLEMDTHITGDRKVILSHDEFINPLFSLAPGGKEMTAAEAKNFAFFRMSYPEIARFDVGRKYYPQFPLQKKMSVSIPLLSDLIDSVQRHIREKHLRQVFYDIETKSSPEADGIYNPDPETFVKLLMEVIEKKKITPWVVIQSFDRRTLQVLHKKYPAIRTSYLISNSKSFDENLSDLGFAPFIYSAASKLITPALVKACHDKGIKVSAWTPNTAAEIQALKTMGVDAIISDDPRLLMN